MEISDARPLPYQISQSFPGKYSSLVKISEFVRKIAQEAGFSSFAIYSIEMAVDEACSNIIEHAYGGEGKGAIYCLCLLDEISLTITLQDKGNAFNPAAVLAPNLSDKIEEREAHGLGIFFIQKWMDEVQFKAEPSGNTLIMVKRRK